MGTVTSASRLIRVVMVDNHGLFRAGLASTLDDYHDIAVLGQASRGAKAIRLVSELRPDVVVIDQHMPDLDGADTTRAILAENPAIGIVVLTEDTDEAAIRAAIDAGASSYVFKDAEIDDIVAAVRATASGASWLAPLAAETVLGSLRHLPVAGAALVPALEASLSKRELEVLRMLTLGLDNKEIAKALSISPRTAKSHVASILSKLGVSNRIQAAVYAVRSGTV